MADSPTDDVHRQFFEKNRAVQLLIEPETGAIVDANPAACAFYGYERDRMRRLRITDLNTLPGEQVLSALAQAGAEQKTRFLFRHRLSSARCATSRCTRARWSSGSASSSTPSSTT